MPTGNRLICRLVQGVQYTFQAPSKRLEHNRIVVSYSVIGVEYRDFRAGELWRDLETDSAVDTEPTEGDEIAQADQGLDGWSLHRLALAQRHELSFTENFWNQKVPSLMGTYRVAL